MDARKYASPFIKPDDVRNGPIQTRIVNVFESERFNNLVLELETGSQFNLNQTNTNTLIKAWGHDTDMWIGQDIELVLGTYQDWHEDIEKETVKLRAISFVKAEGGNGSTASKPPLPPSIVTPPTRRGDMDDEIPF
jgi:hypothetical protein